MKAGALFSMLVSSFIILLHYATTHYALTGDWGIMNYSIFTVLSRVNNLLDLVQSGVDHYATLRADCIPLIASGNGQW